MAGPGARFPTTHWSQLAALGDSEEAGRRTILNLLIERYWRPAYHYARRRGYDNEAAKDAVQEFFTSWLIDRLFERADPARGRFRTFLLTSLSNFLANQYRDAHTQRRHPKEGIVSIRDLDSSSGPSLEPADEETPEDAFNQAWAAGVLMRALGSLEREWAADKRVHFEVFRRRVMEPALEGKAPPSEEELGRIYGLTAKEVANRLLTARRAFRRLLEEEIGVYAASSEDTASEMRDLFEAFAQP